MRATWVIGTIVCMALLLPIGEAVAQGKKQGARCAPNARELCMQRCAERGGQIRLCPRYCEKQLSERGC